MRSWPAATAQFVWFISDTGKFDVSDAFEHLTGVQPDAVQTSRTPTPNMPFLASAQGVQGGVSSQLTLQPNRVDFILQGAAEEGPPTSPPFLPNFEELISRTLPKIKTVTLDKVVRCAVVLNLFELADGQRRATEVVNTLIGAPIHFEDASDLMFQVNRKKRLTVGAIHINRLLRFSVVTFQTVNVAFGPQVAQAVPLMRETFASNFYIDVNTVLTDQALPSPDLPTIWEEMVSEALKIRANGSLGGLAE